MATRIKTFETDKGWAARMTCIHGHLYESNGHKTALAAAKAVKMQASKGAK